MSDGPVGYRVIARRASGLISHRHYADELSAMGGYQAMSDSGRFIQVELEERHELSRPTILHRWLKRHGNDSRS